MKPLLMVLLLTITTPLFAGEAEKANAAAFLEKQTAINEAALGEQTLKIRALGVTVGTMKVKTEAGEYDGTKCYVLTTTAEGNFAGERIMSAKSYIAPNLKLLHGEMTETKDGKTIEHAVVTVKKGVVSVTIERPTDEVEDERRIEATFDFTPGLLLGGAQSMVTMLLPREAGKVYEFTLYSDKAVDFEHGLYPVMVEAVGEENIGAMRAFRFTETGLDFDRDEDLRWVATPAVTQLWYDGVKLSRMIPSDSSVTVDAGPDPKRTPISREMILKRDDKIATTAGFYLGTATRDVPLLKAILNEEKYVRAIYADPEYDGMSAEEKEKLVKQIAPTLVESMFEGEATPVDEAGIKLLMHVEHFEAFEEAGKQIVSFSEEARQLFGTMHFVIEQDADKKWEIVAMVSGLTAGQQRQDAANKMRAAAEALDDEAAKVLFHPDEHENFDKRIGKEFRALKKEGGKVTCKRPTIAEKDGTYFATFELSVTIGGETETETNKLNLIEKDGKWYLSFKK